FAHGSHPNVSGGDRGSGGRGSGGRAARATIRRLAAETSDRFGCPASNDLPWLGHARGGPPTAAARPAVCTPPGGAMHVRRATARIAVAVVAVVAAGTP